MKIENYEKIIILHVVIKKYVPKKLGLKIKIQEREKFTYFCIINKINFKPYFQNFQN